ncbi:xylan 1,4-beta-xylosidase-like [Liolophura sinensis]|uniref:xylan 1,4-beta-xylosidase-like n=1 Tax=Liolophura sinensis TaxID=3198878 RepID=UPI0031580487
MGNFKAISCFSPNLDLHRDPRWGRANEAYSEDPFHVGEYGYKYIKGLHGNHPRYLRASATPKHFDVSGGPESGRMNFDTKVSERDFRTYFLPPFRRGIEAGSTGILCSYNRLNGVPACANDKLLNQVLRKEWKFKGYVIADAGAIHHMIDQHKYYHDAMEACVGSLTAGCNLECQGNIQHRTYLNIPKAIHDGKLKESFVRDMVKPLFYTRMRLGEFDPPQMSPYSTLDIHREVLTHDHFQLAVEVASKTFVLLKNDGVLPIKHKYGTIGVVGPMADEDEQIFGDYKPDTDRHFIRTVLHGLKRMANHVKFHSGCKDVHCNQYESSHVKSTIADVDAIFVVLGTGQAIESEGHDRHDLDLPGHQEDLLQDVVHNNHANKPVILLLLTGSPVNLQWTMGQSHINAIMECFFPAMAAGDAIYNVLTNSGHNSVPAGRLPFTWPESIHQIPSISDYTMSGRSYMYFKGDPMFPFGYGLSYTTFHYDSLHHDNSVQAGHDMSGSVVIHNTGHYDADEVVQVYISWTDHHHPTPQRALAAFDRIHIKKGSSAAYKFTVGSKSMAVWDDHQGWEITAGTIKLYVGGQQPNQKKSVGSNVLAGSFNIHGSKILGKY